MQKALVFGGSGFIGSHVADKLAEADIQTSIFDKQASPWLRADQKMIIGDIMNLDDVTDAVSNVDIVYNFAALADLNVALNEPLLAAQVNILGNINVLEACRINKIKRFVYASTIYVQSRQGGFYRCSKQASEAFVQEYQNKFGLNYTILRFGSLYGPRADEGNSIKRIVKHAIENEYLYYTGNPEAAREYVHVDDAASASVSILEDQYKNQTITVTGHQNTKVIDLLKMLSEILGIPESKIEFECADHEGHYIKTPYSYTGQKEKKFSPPLYVDLGQGLLGVVEEVELFAM